METDDVVYLSDGSYHIHKKDLRDGYVGIEIETFDNICTHLKINVNDIDMLTKMKCMSEIYKCIQITYKSLENKEYK